MRAYDKRKALKAAREELLTVGRLMSNVCSNVSQASWVVDESTRDTMRMLCQRWDEATKQLHELLKGGAK